ncbi:MAG: hypothetical protein NTW08_07980 [Gammaproteobacteria bacterium]|nr:hypothetical protein [Gammaproteobacteria bacterium]
MGLTVDEKEKAAFWSVMNATGVLSGRWSVKKAYFKDHMTQLSALVTTDEEFIKLCQVVSKKKLGEILNDPGLFPTLRGVFSDKSRLNAVVNALEVDDREKAMMVFSESVPYLTEPGEFMDIISALEVGVDKKPFFDKLEGACFEGLCTGRHLISLLDRVNDIELLRPLLHHYAEKLNSGLGRQIQAGLGAPGLYSAKDWATVLIRCAKAEASACLTPKGILKAADRALYQHIATRHREPELEPRQIEAAAAAAAAKKEVTTIGGMMLSTQLARAAAAHARGDDQETPPSTPVVKPK